MTLSVSSFVRLARWRTALAGLALACTLATLPAPTYAAAEQRPRELQEKTSTELQKLSPLLDAKNWEGALALVQSAKSKVPADSYDALILSDIEAKVYLQKGDYAKAIPVWETTVKLADAHNYMEPRTVQEIIYFLGQLHYQEASTSKNRDVQKQHFAKSIAFLERWLKGTDKPDRDPTRQDAQVFFANVLYNLASLDPDNIDQDLLKKAEQEVQKGLRMTTKPKETLYLILLAIAQQQNDYPRLAELLELLLAKSPSKKDFWPQLAGVYLALAAQEKDEVKAREHYTRAILAIERAQSLGFMKSPKENYNLVGTYFNVGQFGRATEILHSGLRDGSIENDLKNWELLAYSYQQVDKPYQAIDALQEGTKKFPDSGQLDYQAATIYYSLNKPEEAFKHLQQATKKGNLDKPGAVYAFLGYVSWDLGKLDEASAAIEKALSYPDGQRDAQLPRLKEAVENAIRERAVATGAATASR